MRPRARLVLRRIHGPLLFTFAAACADPSATSTSLSGGIGDSSGAADTLADDGDGPGSGEGADTTGTAGGSGPIFDVGADDSDSAMEQCHVGEDNDGAVPCGTQAPPDSFEPETQWIWPAIDPGAGGLRLVYSTPLVANLTDDDGNGSVDLCDVPDVVVIAFRTWTGPTTPGALVVLDGATGAEHFVGDGLANASVTPALGDIDADGIVEIVTVDPARRVVAYHADGSLVWASDPLFPRQLGPYGLAVALADLDADADVEIIAGEYVLDNEGTVLWSMVDDEAENTYYSTHTAADLDGDGMMEVVAGHSAWHYDGTLYWSQIDLFSVGQDPLHEGLAVYPAVANFDDDADPEVLVTGTNGVSLLEHDGTPIFVAAAPIDPPETSFGGTGWTRPATVHNFDADPEAEIATSSADATVLADHYSMFDITANGPPIRWTAEVVDHTGSAAGTAFDFLGDGTAEAIYGDENAAWVYDATGAVLLQLPRSSGTIMEYPTVADIDNDGSAELLITSASYVADIAPGVRAVKDADDRWVPARRIWNQHTYHVTNVREDGSIPQVEPHHWELLNTFRTQAQLEGNGVCDPAG